MLTVLQRWPEYRRWSCVRGLVFMAASLVASSFANTVWELILTQGVLYAIGGVFAYAPIIIFIDEWFVRKKSLAMGIVFVSPASFSNSFRPESEAESLHRPVQVCPELLFLS